MSTANFNQPKRQILLCLFFGIALAALPAFRFLTGSAHTKSVQTGNAQWNATGNLLTPRFRHTAVMMSGGTVLVAGGADGNFRPSSKAEIYDPATKTWSAAGEMSSARFGHTAIRLANGKVLLAGGTGLKSAEIYDPVTRTWTATGSLVFSRENHTAVLLPNGKVLVAGGIDSSGRPLDSAELFDPNAAGGQGGWTLTGNLMTARESHAAVLLANGKVLVTGGAGANALKSSELYDISTGQWNATGEMMTARLVHTASVLANGKVLVAGGFSGSQALKKAEIYDPLTGLWNPAPDLNSSRYAHTATLMSDNRVLMTGGVDLNGNAISAAEFFDPSGAGGAGNFTLTGSLNVAREEHTATLLQNGQVLAAGGVGIGSVLVSAELFSLTSNCPSISILPETIAAGTLGQAYSAITFAQSGGTAPLSFALSGTLPAGMNFSGGNLAGTPTQAGNFPITIIVTDANNCSGSRNYTLVINCQPIAVNPAILPAAIIGKNYNQVFTQNGGVGNITYSLSGNLPSGLQFSPTGSLFGTPSQLGTFPITVSATDVNNCIGSRSYILEIVCPLITLSPVVIPTAMFGAVYNQTITQTGGTGAVTFTLTGSLPEGLQLSANGSLSGTPVQLGRFSFTVTATDSNNCAGSINYSIVVTTTPGLAFQAGSSGSDQLAGSVLIYNLYTSSATNSNTQNTRVGLTNVNDNQSATVHLFFIDGSSGSLADSLICLTPNQTANLLTSDIDPGVTGYVIAVAVDRNTGCPVNFNFLIGDAYLKTITGHAANLGAEALTAISNQPVICAGTTASLNFDGMAYCFVARSLGIPQIADRASGNSTLLIVNRIGGNLITGAIGIGAIAGTLFDDVENGYGFTANAASGQFRSLLSNGFPRTVPQFDQVIPAGRSGWLKLWATGDQGLSGSAINFNQNARANPNAFLQGQNLQHLTLTNSASLTIPIIPPSC